MLGLVALIFFVIAIFKLLNLILVLFAALRVPLIRRNVGHRRCVDSSIFTLPMSDRFGNREPVEVLAR